MTTMTTGTATTAGGGGLSGDPISGVTARRARPGGRTGPAPPRRASARRGVHGLSPSVTHLTPAQREAVVRITVDEAAGRVPVVAGVAAFAIADAAAQAQAMASWGRRPRRHPAGSRPAVPRRDRRPRPRARHGHGPAGRPLHESASRGGPAPVGAGADRRRRDGAVPRGRVRGDRQAGDHPVRAGRAAAVLRRLGPPARRGPRPRRGGPDGRAGLRRARGGGRPVGCAPPRRPGPPGEAPGGDLAAQRPVRPARGGPARQAGARRGRVPVRRSPCARSGRRRSRSAASCGRSWPASPRRWTPERRPG